MRFAKSSPRTAAFSQQMLQLRPIHFNWSPPTRAALRRHRDQHCQHQAVLRSAVPPNALTRVCPHAHSALEKTTLTQKQGLIGFLEPSDGAAFPSTPLRFIFFNIWPFSLALAGPGGLVSSGSFWESTLNPEQKHFLEKCP